MKIHSLITTIFALIFLLFLIYWVYTWATVCIPAYASGLPITEIPALCANH